MLAHINRVKLQPTLPSSQELSDMPAGTIVIAPEDYAAKIRCVISYQFPDGHQELLTLPKDLQEKLEEAVQLENVNISIPNDPLAFANIGKAIEHYIDLLSNKPRILFFSDLASLATLGLSRFAWLYTLSSQLYDEAVAIEQAYLQTPQPNLTGIRKFLDSLPSDHAISATNQLPLLKKIFDYLSDNPESIACFEYDFKTGCYNSLEDLNTLIENACACDDTRPAFRH